jgi:DNA-binding PadR family transcriptional regulator
MEDNGWIRRTGDSTHPRARRSFRITPAGRKLLAQLQDDVRELYAEIVLGKEPGSARRSRRAAARKKGRRS